MNTNTELNPNGLADARYEMAKSTVRGEKLENAIRAYLPHHDEQIKDDLVREMAYVLNQFIVSSEPYNNVSLNRRAAKVLLEYALTSQKQGD